MNLSLKVRVVLILVFIACIPMAFFVYHYFAMKGYLIEEAKKQNATYTNSLVNRFTLFFEENLSEIQGLVSLYENLGLSSKQVIWRITGHVKSIFEGAFYSFDGYLIDAVSRETSNPNFEPVLDLNHRETKVLGVRYTDYREPFLRIYIPTYNEGVFSGFYIFSLDLSLFWQELISSVPSKDTYLFLTDSDGNIVAFSDLRYSDLKKVELRRGVYVSPLLKETVVGTFGTLKGMNWAILVETPLSSVLFPLRDFQLRALTAEILITFLSSTLGLIVILKVFKPLENLRDRVVSLGGQIGGDPISKGNEVRELSQVFENLLKKLEEEKRLYMNLFENSLEGVLLFDEKNRVIDVNCTLLQKLGMDKEDLLGLSMEEMVKGISNGQVYFPEKSLRIVDRELICELRQSYINVNGKRYTLWHIRDVSEEKELKTLLEKTSKLSLAGEIACSIAHQINNPLASIMGYSESIILQSSEEKIREKAKIVVRQAERCADTVKKLLDIGKPFEGKPDYVDPAKLTIEVINLLRTKAKRKGIEIGFVAHRENMRIFTFQWQLEQVLLNIIDNAIDASRSKVNVYLDREGDNLVWKITDDGEGIPKEVLSKVFDPFFTTKEEGTGLGLSLAKRLVKNLGGDIRIQSLNGSGTEVYVYVMGESHENTDS